MEVDKIAVNDNFSSETQKNKPVGLANEQDVRIFRKHVADEHKENVSTDLSDNSEESVQDFGNLFRRLKLPDEKEQTFEQQSNDDSQESQQNTFYLKNPKKESDVQGKKLPQASIELSEDTTKVQKDSLNQIQTKTSIDLPKDLAKLPSDDLNKEVTKKGDRNIAYCNGM